MAKYYIQTTRGRSAQVLPSGPGINGPGGVWVNVTPSGIVAGPGNGGFTGALFTVVADPLQLSDVYVSAFYQGIWKSTDYGLTWNGPINTGTVSAGQGTLQLSIAPNVPGLPILYGGGISAPPVGFWRSLDGGITWANYNIAGLPSNRQDCYQPSVNPYNPQHLLICGHEQDFLGESFNGGQTWTTKNLDAGMRPGAGTNFPFFIDTGNAGTTATTWIWIAQASGGTFGTWRTTNSGTSWTQVDTNEHNHGNCQIYQSGGGVIYMAGVYSALGWGVLRSTNYGVTWTHVGAAISESTMWGTPSNVYVGQGGAVGFGGTETPSLQLAPTPGTSWSMMGDPAGMTQGPGGAAVVTDGSRWAMVAGCWSSGIWRYIEPGSGSGADGSGDITIQRLSPQQTIDGFGANEAFLDAISLSTGQADMLFGTSSGQIGLSLLLLGIDTNGATMGNWATAAQAVARGVKLLAQPWSAAAAQKDNGSVINGGHLLVASYGAWSDTMVAFDALAVTNAGAHISYWSVQNEPDFSAAYATMLYTTAEMVAFLKVLGPKIRALGTGALIMLPATSNWDNSQAYATAVLADGTAAQYLDIGATHQYFGTPALVAAGKKTWQTEMSWFSGFDPTMTMALTMAMAVHNALTVGNVSVWMYWWMIRASQGDNEALTDTTQNTKRMWALGNWARFVRPGAVRLATTGSAAGVSVTAFVSSGVYVVVAINTGGGVALTFGLPGTLTTMTPYLTDATHDLAAQAALPVVAGVMSTTLVASSVTTFVGS